MLRIGSLLSVLLVVVIVTVACQPIQPEAAGAAALAANSVGPDDPVGVQIANAMSAAPLAIAKDATILGFPTEEGGEMVVLRQGTNGWTCIANWPASPGEDPSCNDEVWMAWNDAYAAGTEPEITRLGIGYMLSGGSDPSATDPYAMQPAEGEEWVNSPAHLMLLAPGGFDSAAYPTTPTAGEPYIMWDGTPYEHLMVPVVPVKTDSSGALDASATVEAQIANALSSAPVTVGQGSTIVNYPPEGESQLVLLREGDNGWTCYPDWLASPVNDPQCFDPVFQAFFEALWSGAAPEIPATGIAYMLQGGGDPSNTDPMAMQPATDEEWVLSPAHVMLVSPGGFDSAYFTTDHASGYPYIMWDGTPYEHLMVPVSDPPGQSMVIDGVGPSTAGDPTQAQAENEFREVALSRERSYYAEDFDRFMSYYADNVVSLEPGSPDKVGKEVLAEGMKPFMEGYDTNGQFTLKGIWVSGEYATRWGEWDEVVTPVDGGKPFHQLGRCFLGWQKIDGEWKIVSQILNFVEPPTELE